MTDELFQKSADMNLSAHAASLTEGMTFLQDDATLYQSHNLTADKKSTIPTTEGNFKTSFYNPFEIKHRKRTSRAQFKVLEKTFLENPKPNASVRRWLAQQLVMTPRGVQVWFQNRRAKEKSKKDKKPISEPLVKQSSTSSYESISLTPLSSSSTSGSPPPSVCNCPDCFTTPMSRTLSYLDEDIMSPVTPLDNYFFMNRQQQQQQWASPAWTFAPEEESISYFNPPMMRRMYTASMVFDNNRRTSNAFFDDKSIQSTEVYIYNNITLKPLKLT